MVRINAVDEVVGDSMTLSDSPIWILKVNDNRSWCSASNHNVVLRLLHYARVAQTCVVTSPNKVWPVILTECTALAIGIDAAVSFK